MVWSKRQRLADHALNRGDFHAAAEQLRDPALWQTAAGKRLATRLVQGLIDQAEASAAGEDFGNAWKSLTTAQHFADSPTQDRISRRMNRLVDLTIETAESHLGQGKITHALQLVEQLSKRQILDWRADRICKVADGLHRAEEWASLGKMKEAVNEWTQVKNYFPSLPQIDTKLSAGQQQAIRMQELVNQLQVDVMKCQWAEASQHCEAILQIAPKHAVALEAKRHCQLQMQRKTAAGRRATHVPENRISTSNSFFQLDANASTGGPPARSAAEQLTSCNLESETVVDLPIPASLAPPSRFLMWIDGVGGFLVCTEIVNTIGLASESTTVAIPMVGDIRGRHARFQFTGDSHLLEPLWPVSIDGTAQNLPTGLKHEQVVQFEGGVQLKYLRPHPLSKTARLDFASRHRTRPWSDGILLAAQSIILGPNRANHVFCPTWKSDLIIFRRKEKWLCRAKTDLQIDGKPCGREGEIRMNSTINSDEFSITLEPI